MHPTIRPQLPARIRRLTTRTVALVALALGMTAPAQAAEPGSNGRFAYSKGGSIWVMNADGTGKTNLGRQAAYAPAWSPDGTKIAFLQQCEAEFPVFCLAVMDANGANMRYYTQAMVYTTGGAPDDQPTWSPDGYKIAVTSNENGGDDIYLVDSNLTGSPQKLTFDGASRHPDFGRNGKIAFVGPYGNQGVRAVWTMDASGNSRAWRVTYYGPLSAPDWRGEVLAFASNGNIYTEDRSGAFGTPGTDDNPVLSPDGTAVAFTSDSSGAQGVYVQSLSGGATTRLDDATGPFDWESVAPPSRPLGPRMTCCAP